MHIPREQFQNRGLAGSVRTENGRVLAFRETERKVVEDAGVASINRGAADVEDRLHVGRQARATALPLSRQDDAGNIRLLLGWTADADFSAPRLEPLLLLDLFEPGLDCRPHQRRQGQIARPIHDVPYPLDKYHRQRQRQLGLLIR